MQKCLLFIFFSICLIGCGASSIAYKPTEVNVTGDYIHIPTKVVFPQSLGMFRRSGVTSFNKEESNVGVSYDTPNAHITIYLYPAGIAHSNRLYNEFYSVLQSIANVENKEIQATQQSFKYSEKGYNLIGLNADIKKDDGKNTILTLFECSNWFLKYRITSKGASLKDLQMMRDTLKAHFSPIDIVSRSPLKQKSEIQVTKLAFQDTLTLHSVLRGALAQTKWVEDNVDSLQRCSGYPGLYLDEYTVSLLEMQAVVKEAKLKDEHKEYYNTKYGQLIKTLNMVTENSFLNEFVMSEYNLLLIPSQNTSLNMDGYRKWAKGKVKKGLLNELYYYIQYNE